jgi:CheY-like chemotaxis protein
VHEDTYVLIVDDSPDNREIMTELVRSMDIPVRVATDGHEALQHIHQKAPGFVILDLMMPGMSGLSVLARLKLDIEKHKIPTLIITSLPLTEREIDLLSASVLGVIRKGDIDMKDLAYLIQETLNDRRT